MGPPAQHCPLKEAKQGWNNSYVAAGFGAGK
jgi:hypothetical protein